MEYGIFFKHPLDRKRGLDYLDNFYKFRKNPFFNLDEYNKQNSEQHLEDNLQKWFINIEVSHQEEFNVDKILEFLNKHYNSGKKLFDLQSHGKIFRLEKTPNESDTELTRFKQQNFGKFCINEDASFGELIYYIDDKDGHGYAKLEVPLYATFGEENILFDAYDVEWDYAFIFNEKTKTFSYKKVEET